ncbi:MAG: LysR family transcriptional regulator [Acidobacteriaceae bacterium]|nr:LysR family transcriptional regulator [Acidobacteriaceae bacterium]
MDLRQLEMFKVVAQTGGFTRASENLHVSHSAVSRQIRLLEDEIGGPLFSRANKKVCLTAGGRALLPYAEAIFIKLAEAFQQVSEIARGPSKRLSIGTGTTMVNTFLPPVLQEFRATHPMVEVCIKTAHTSIVLEDIRGGDIDIGIVSLPVDSAGLTVDRLYREEIVIGARSGHALARKKSIPAKELSKLPVVIYSRHSSTRTVLDEFFRQIGVEPLISMEVENDEAAERAIANGGVCFLPADRAKLDKIRVLRVDGHEIYRHVAIVSRPVLSGVVADFANVCRDHARMSQPESRSASHSRT